MSQCSLMSMATPPPFFISKFHITLINIQWRKFVRRNLLLLLFQRNYLKSQKAFLLALDSLKQISPDLNDNSKSNNNNNIIIIIVIIFLNFKKVSLKNQKYCSSGLDRQNVLGFDGKKKLSVQPHSDQCLLMRISRVQRTQLYLELLV